MLVKCPKCSTGFNLPKEKIPGSGAKLKCSACTHKFRVRVGSDDKAEYFYKKGEEPAPGFGEDDDSSPGTTVGAPNMGLEEESEKTQFGFNARSKSAREGYNPFPLAAGAQEEDSEPESVEESGNSTQLFSGVGQPVDESDEIDLDGPDHESGNRTVLGAATFAVDDEDDDGVEIDEAAGDRTSIGVPGKAGLAGPPKIPGGDDAGNRTQALGSGMDLFGEDDFFGGESGGKAKPPSGSSAALLTNVDDDPFGDAFDEPIDGDVGLLMPSTPSMDLASPSDEGLSSSSSGGLEEISGGGMSEESLFLGGHSDSDFGRPDDLVDPNFGSDVPSFDASEGVVESAERPRVDAQKKKKRESGQFGVASDEKIELVDVRTEERERRASNPAPPAHDRPEMRSEERARQTGEHAREKRPIASGYAPHRIGATSPIRRTFDVIFIALVVVNVLVVFVAFRAGGFVDLTRFGHMLEVAFEGADFEPREEWAVVVEAEPVTPPPEEPLRLRDVRAFEANVGKDRVLVIRGKIRNYSAKAFSGLKLRAEVTDPENKILAEQTQPGGRSLDRKAVKNAKSAEDVSSAIETKIPDVGKEGTIEFAFVFDDVPAKVLDSGAYSYRVALAD